MMTAMELSASSTVPASPKLKPAETTQSRTFLS
jgi:hypothetical protein